MKERGTQLEAENDSGKCVNLDKNHSHAWLSLTEFLQTLPRNREHVALNQRCALCQSFKGAPGLQAQQDEDPAID